jgi:translin
MERIDGIAEKIEGELDEKEEVRERALKSSRNIIKLCGRAIRAMHVREEPVPLIQEAMKELNSLLALTSDFPDIKHSGAVESAMQEYVEACLLQRIYHGKELTGPDELGVSSEAYILGVGDLIGEVRRITLDNIRSGEVQKASDNLITMERLYEFLMRFHYPNGLVAIRRKQDIARGILEKTRGDVAVAVRSHSLEQLLEDRGE